ncbi:serine/threonine-protein kinase [Chroococcidiopsis sp. CCNUC1]|uniref:serine/threonine-protein kinase n=1 Tax=Chroococcidiopsis sp. CCNUC1 TaxID=2653189 RepID=UPI0020202AAE|nr:serine/threonine-protein kinase [Chroococcidiopsis sp. CCNUC1]URD53318.1 serine/threonine protein kinase [Chroococcidiopsis sp. CCNUC1]
MRGKLLGGRYQVVEVLANGGFGQTYVAQDMHRPGNPRCVVKHLQPASVNSKFLHNARRLFQTEAEILEQLGNHDQIPRLLAYFEEHQEFYLVQEFIQGHTLTKELLPGDRWEESKVYQLLQEVLEILVFVHAHAAIHRDIKPDNLIRRIADGKLVLVDFGSVKQVWTQVFTRTGQQENSPPATIAIGTPGYMPTEQGQGRPQPNSDIYALGTIAIQALTGMNPSQLAEQSDTGEIEWRQHAKVSEGLGAVIAKMVRYNSKNRYQTAVAALVALRQLANFPTLLQPVIGIQPPPASHFNQSNVEKYLTLVGTPKGIEREVKTELPENHAETHTVTMAGLDTNPTTEVATQAIPVLERIPDPPAIALVNPDRSTPAKASRTRQRYPLRVGAALTAVLASVAAMYVTNWHPVADPEQTLEQMNALKTARKYQECIDLASTHSSTNAKLQAGLQQCRLAQAQQLAATDLSAAIALSSQIPSTDPLYPVAKPSIAQWTNRLLEKAKTDYEAGNLPQAIALVKAIPITNPVYQTAQTAIAQWQRDWQNNRAAWEAAKSAAAVGKWQDVLQATRKVTIHPYWQQQIAPLAQQAAIKIALASNTAIPPQQSRAATKPPQSRTQPVVTPSRPKTVTDRPRSRPNRSRTAIATPTSRPQSRIRQTTVRRTTVRRLQPISRRVKPAIARRTNRPIRRRARFPVGNTRSLYNWQTKTVP